MNITFILSNFTQQDYSEEQNLFEKCAVSVKRDRIKSISFKRD